MIQRLIDLFSVNNDPTRLRAIIRKQADIIRKQELKIAELQSENRSLRRRLADAELRLLRRAEADAVLLGALHFSGCATSRRACADVGLGHRRWRRAVALLQVGRVHDGRCITTDAPEDFERSVRVAGERVRRHGAETLRHRMPLYSKR